MSTNLFKKGDARTIRLAKKAGKASYLKAGKDGMRARGLIGLQKRWAKKVIHTPSVAIQ